MIGDLRSVIVAPQGWVGRWSPGIGDPTLLGWLTVAAYVGAAWLCLRARRVALVEQAAGERRGAVTFWGLGALALAALALNKQLDLQTALTEFGRVIAHEQGWYERRRFVQLGAVILVGLATVAACGAGCRLARGNLRRLWLAILGALELGAFVIIRATSIHKVDKLIGADFLGVRVNGWLELGGISCIAFAAWRYRLPVQPRH